MKIDTSAIAGYEDMSAEEKLSALEGYDIPEPDHKGYIKKDRFDQVASELAAKKRELRDKMSDEEAAKAKADEERAELESNYNELLKKVTVSENKAKFLAMGYSEELAADTALAMFEGNTDAVFANQKKHLEAFEKSIRADSLQATPRPEGGAPSGKMTLDALKKMSSGDRYRFSVDHPDEYRELYGGDE